MNRIKRTIVILAIIVTTMLIIPFVAVNTVKADAGMLVAMMLFFLVNPAVSIVIGILAGKDIKFFWFTPLLIAGLFWAFSSLTYETAFPIVYSAIYLVVSAISMVITWTIAKRTK